MKKNKNKLKLVATPSEPVYVKLGIKWDKGIPVPMTRFSLWLDFVKQAADGDSCIVHNASHVVGIRNAATKLGFKVTTRYVDIDEWRVWVYKA